MKRLVLGIGVVLAAGLFSGVVLGYWYSQRNYVNCYPYHINKTNIQMTRLEEKKNIIPIAILGSGPAGLSAAIYGARSNIYTVVFQGAQP
ncbi:MAG: hypothetical protein ACYC2U_08860, partial [Candidatus Amoebophilus sp.]